MKGSIVLVVLCATAAFAVDTFEESSTQIALSVYGDCSKSEDLYVCLKKKAFTLLDRLGRSDNFSISDSVKVIRSEEAPAPKEEITESKLEQLLPRSLDAKNAALTDMLSKKITEYIGSRTVEISLPRSFSDDDVSEEGKIYYGMNLPFKIKKKNKLRNNFDSLPDLFLIVNGPDEP